MFFPHSTLRLGEFEFRVHTYPSPKPKEFQNAGFHFRADGKPFESGAFRKRWRHDNEMIFLPEFS